MLDLSKINEFAERSACFMFQATFDEDLGVVHDRVSMMQSTVDVSIILAQWLYVIVIASLLYVSPEDKMT